MKSTITGALLVGGDHGEHIRTVISPSTVELGKWHATRIDGDEPIGHTVYESAQQAIDKEVSWGATLCAIYRSEGGQID